MASKVCGQVSRKHLEIFDSRQEEKLLQLCAGAAWRWLLQADCTRPQFVWLGTGVIKKAGEIRNPPPSRAFVLIDESVNSVDDGCFMISAVRGTTSLQNSPTARHSRGATLTLAGGHVERWGWRELVGEPVQGVTVPNDLKRLQSAFSSTY